MDNNILISIIIPAYNVEDYIEDCLNSVINQSLSDIEIICIDDASTDMTGKILNQYKNKDSRIKVISNSTNIGQGASRNKALEVAKGKNIYFLDSDDYLSSVNSLQIMYKTISDNEADMVCFASKAFSEIENLSDTYQFSAIKNKEYTGIYDGITSYLTLVKHHAYRSPAWLYLYSTDFIKTNNLYFLTGIASEDVSFAFDTHLVAKKVVIIDDILHCYRIRDNSQTHSKKRIYRVKSAEKNMKHFLSKIWSFNGTDKNIKKMYGLEYNNEIDFWKRRFDSCEYEEKLNYINSIDNYLIKDLFLKKVLNQEYLLPEIIMDNLKKKEIWLYGAGKYARKILHFLDSHGIEVEGIVTSNNLTKKFMGYQVFNFNSWNEPINALVIPAVSDIYREEIKNIIIARNKKLLFDISEYELKNI